MSWAGGPRQRRSWAGLTKRWAGDREKEEKTALVLDEHPTSEFNLKGLEHRLTEQKLRLEMFLVISLSIQQFSF